MVASAPSFPLPPEGDVPSLRPLSLQQLLMAPWPGLRYGSIPELTTVPEESS